MTPRQARPSPYPSPVIQPHNDQKHQKQWGLDALARRPDQIIEKSNANGIIADPHPAPSIPAQHVFTSGRYQIREFNHPSNP